VNYRLEIRHPAQKDMQKLPNNVLRRVNSTIKTLAEDPYQRGVTKLKDQVGFRVRAGSYRVIYDVDDSSRTVSVLRVRHRREAYR